MADLKVEYYGGTRSWSQAGSAVSALIAGALVFYSGNYRIIFLASVFPYIAGLLLMISYPNELNATRSSQCEASPGGGLVGSLRETIRNFLGTFKDPCLTLEPVFH